MHLQNSILGLAIIIVAGYAGAKVLRKIHLPAVTAYLLIGILIGPRLLSLLPVKIIDLSGFISHFVLGVIAFSLGENFTLKDIKKAGKAVVWISILEAGVTWILVTLVVIVYFLLKHAPIHPALILGAAAAATAPAATVMVIREYRSSGPVTNMLLRVVAIDDAWCLVFSAIAMTIANELHTNSLRFSIIGIALAEILASLSLGALFGFGLHYLSKFIKMRDELLTVISGFILIMVGLSMRLHLSPLLTSMVSGVVISNVSKNSIPFFKTLRNVDAILFLSFFILAGANLEISIIPQIGILGVLYIIFRVIGKFIGVRIGVWKSHANVNVGKYLAWGLVPQAGVALGVALAAKTLYPEFGGTIFTTITATTVIYELIGPFCAKYGLGKAGEI